MSDQDQMLQIIEAAIFAAGEPLAIEKLALLFDEQTRPSTKEIRDLITTLAEFYQNRGIELIEVGSGFRFQAKASLAPWLQRLWEKKPPRYSRSLLETLALVAYRQPITRGEIEEIRGVAVNTYIIKTLTERNWVKVVGHKDVPGKPALFGTTKEFLDYFNIKSLTELPTLDAITDLEAIEKQLNAQMSLDVESSAMPENPEENIEENNEEEIEAADMEAAVSYAAEAIAKAKELELRAAEYELINEPEKTPA